MKLLQTIRGQLNTLFLFRLADGNLIESVFYRGDTLCVSTQVGCGVRCGFCASGKKGLVRNLSSEEIVSQYLLLPFKEVIKRIAVAGIGEPLANWESVLEAFRFFKGQGLKVSFYTSGYPLRRLGELMELPHSGLTISIHSLRPSMRKELMPGSGDPLRLVGFLRNRLKSLSKRKRSKISLGYLLLGGINDREEDVLLLGKTALELGISVTLLRFNEVGSFRPSDDETYERFFRILRSMGVKVTLSTRFRRDKIGGCGTLVVNRLEGEEVKI
jgi:23S rRNA (adenine2503-C2)-methyltransferase